MAKTQAYVLENEKEFERLEKQSETPAYDFREELSALDPLIKTVRLGRVLDAGCGSGIVTRHLATSFPKAEIHGCDASDMRIGQACQVSSEHGNLKFQAENLEALSYPTNHFDLIVCRFVLQHMQPKQRIKALQEMQRCLRPGGVLCVIDIDGLLYNLAPLTASLKKQLEKISQNKRIDLCIGRKIPEILVKLGLQSVSWTIHTPNFRGDLLQTEIKLTGERFESASEFFVTSLGSKDAASRFKRDYLKTMSTPGSVLFYNKFVITARKTSPHLVGQ